MNQERLMLTARWLYLSTLLVLGSGSVQAHAQWLPDRNYTEGPGLRVGDLELHPGVAARAGYDSNVFRSDLNRIDSGLVAITPHLNIQTLSLQRMQQGEDAAGATEAPVLPKIALSAGLAGTFFYYFDKRAPTNFEADTEATVSILPERVFGLDVGAAYQRNVRPFGPYVGLRANNLYAEDRIKPSISFRAQSRSGVLKGSIGYAPLIDIFENRQFSYLSSTMHGVGATAAWKFLPFTALLYDGGAYFTRYFDLDRSNAYVLLSDSDRFQSRVGVNGAVTNTIAVRAMAGYAVVAMKNDLFDDVEDVIGEAAVTFSPGVSKFELGYRRSIDPANLGGWMRQDRGYLQAGTLLGGAVALNLEAGAGRAQYGRLLDADGDPLGIDGTQPTAKREDVRVDAGFHVEYRATNWLAFLLDLSMLANFTDFEFQTGAAPFPAEYKTYQAFGGVRAHY